MEKYLNIEPVDAQIEINVKTEPSEEGSLPDCNVPEKPPQLQEEDKNAYKRQKIDFYNKTTEKSCTITSKESSVNNKEEISENEVVCYNEEHYTLIVFNFPVDWTYDQIKSYLDQVCGEVDIIESLNKYTIKLAFMSLERSHEAYKKLKDNFIQGKQLEVVMIEPTMTFFGADNEASGQNDGASDTTETIDCRPWRPDLDMWDIDPQGMYGLRPEFLKTLNITPPIDRWVHVTNFTCDKSELKEVMKLAGNVLMCCVVTIINRCAKVMYSHPLEAIQAISMLDGQIFYGTPLRVIMDRNPINTIVLPEGLANIGLGFGLEGKPLLNIAHQYHRYASNQSSLINPVVFSKVNYYSDESTIWQHEDSSESDIQQKIDEFIASTQFCHSSERRSFKVQNIEELDNYDTNNMEKIGISTPEPNDYKLDHVKSRNSSLGFVCPTPKNGVQKPYENFPIARPKAKPLLGPIAPPKAKPLIGPIAPPKDIPLMGPIAPTQAHHDRANSVPKKQRCRSSKFHPCQICMQSPQATASFLHISPVHQNFGPGPTTFNQMYPFGPRFLPFMPMQNSFAPRSFSTASRPTSVIRSQMPPANFSVPRPFVGPSPAVPRPNMNPGNSVTVHLVNLPPSTTFPWLSEKLAHCGQLISIQLTTPGCAVVTFSHPSHAERCFQMYNQANVDGYIIEVEYA